MAFTLAAATIISSIVSIIGTAYSAKVASDDLAKAQAENKSLDNRDFFAQQKANAIGNASTQKQLGQADDRIALDRARFGEEQRKNNYQITRDQVTQVEKLLNTNIGLKNDNLSRWKQ